MEGVYLSYWKLATICAVPTEGTDSSQTVSYRPVAMLSCVSKLFERLIHEQLMKCGFENDILPHEQFGFLKERSAEWQLLSILENWHVELNNHKHVHAGFLDAAKRFDRVDDSILLKTLSDIGIGDVALQWFQSCQTV